MQISPANLRDLIEHGEDGPRLIDVREPYEHERCNIGGILVPLVELEEFLEADILKRDDDIVVYCRSGRRSAAAVQFLRHHGFASARSLSGGLRAWRHEVDPTMPEP